MDERHLVIGARYVERNPVRAGLAPHAWAYEWSSAKWHAGRVSEDPWVAQDDLLPLMVADWRRFVSEADDEDDLHRFRKESSVGRPLGDEEFIIGLERKLGRMLRRRPPGRPRKHKDQQRRAK